MSERMMAPVVLFTYNRPEHTKHTIEALAANELAEKTELFVFSDAAKKEADAAKVGDPGVCRYGAGICKCIADCAERELRACPKRDRGCDGDRQPLWQGDRPGG